MYRKKASVSSKAGLRNLRSLGVLEEVQNKDGTFEVKRDVVPKHQIANVPASVFDDLVKNPSKIRAMTEEFSDLDLSNLDQLGLTTPELEAEWFHSDNKQVFIRNYSVIMGVPFVGLVLNSNYFKWNSDSSIVPAFFMPIFGYTNKTGPPYPSEDNLRLQSMYHAELAAYKASPAVVAIYLGDAFSSDKGLNPKRVLHFVSKTEDLKRAVKFYHDASMGTCKVLSYITSKINTFSSETFISRFEISPYLTESQLPRISTFMVELKFSLYCRDYERFCEI